MMRVLRIGAQGEDVRRWQDFLVGRGASGVVADGDFGPRTLVATKAYQRFKKIQQDGVVGPGTLARALLDGFDPGLQDSQPVSSGPDWPPAPDFQPLITDAQRVDAFGKFDYRPKGGVVKPGGDVEILGGWEGRNMVAVDLPGLGRLRKNGKDRVRFHAKAADALRALWDAWSRAGFVTGLVHSWGGAFNPRFIRGSTSRLSNHAWGTAFDINVEWNRLGHVPALRGEKGSVREMVPIANTHGFYWGGHFVHRKDGMHFEMARLPKP